MNEDYYTLLTSLAEATFAETCRMHDKLGAEWEEAEQVEDRPLQSTISRQMRLVEAAARAQWPIPAGEWFGEER